VHASPAIVDGKLYIGSWDSYFYALDAATGKELWRFKTGEDHEIHNQVGIQSSATVANGLVYFGCRDSNFYALDASTGKKRWVFSNKGSWVISSPVVQGGQGLLCHFGLGALQRTRCTDRRTHRFDQVPLAYLWFAIHCRRHSLSRRTGRKLVALDLTSRKPVWIFQSEGSRQNLAALSKPDGSPNYEAAFSSNFYDDMIVGVSKVHAAGTILSSPVISGNMVYIGSADGNLYALE
jgi:outer membrane protein assembly factor BamB